MGALQGNSPSPLQYNFCEQIALIKIELDPQIASVYNHMLVPRDVFPLEVPEQVPVPAHVPVPDPPPSPPGLDPALPAPARPEWGPFDLESNRETDKVESFADDKTATFKATRAGLSAICDILENFAHLVGLDVTWKKVQLCMWVTRGPPPTIS